MLGWLRSVHPPNANTVGSVRTSWEATTPLWEATVSPFAPTATPYSCGDERNAVVARKLRAEVALWHQNDAAWRETRPWIVPPNTFPWPEDDGPRVVEPPWMRACDAEWAGGAALATPADLASRCLDAFRAALRQWFYGEPDAATDAFPRAPLSREPCSGASVLAHAGASSSTTLGLGYLNTTLGLGYSGASVLEPSTPSSPSMTPFIVYERGVATAYRQVSRACNLVYIKVIKCASSTTGECAISGPGRIGLCLTRPVPWLRCPRVLYPC